MKALTWLLAALGLAIVLFAAGLLSPLSPSPSGGAPAAPSPTTEMLTGPGDRSSESLDQTIGSLQSRLEAQDDDWRSYASLGLAYLQKARLSADPSYYPKAEGTLRRSLTLNEEENFDAALGMSILAAARHDFQTALRWGKRATALDLYSAEARATTADALVELGRYEAAGRVLQKAVDLSPDLSTYARVSYFRELHGDVAGAREAMSAAVDAGGGAPKDAAWAAYQLGELFFGEGRLERASFEYRRSAYLSSGYALADAGLAKVAAARGRLEHATSLLTDVVRRLPSPELVTLLGDLERLAGRRGEARRQYGLVRAMEKLLRANGVSTDLEISLFNIDHGIDVRSALARTRSEYQVRKSVHAADTLSWALYANGKYEAARRLSHKALRLGTQSALFHYHAGMIAYRLDDRDGAAGHLERALEINPHFSFLHRDDAVRILRRLRDRSR